MIYMIIFLEILYLLMNSRELKESTVEELMKMSKQELLKLATSHWNSWIRASVELEKCYKDEGRTLSRMEKYEEGNRK